jgi:hypothetical protein
MLVFNTHDYVTFGMQDSNPLLYIQCTRRNESSFCANHQGLNFVFWILIITNLADMQVSLNRAVCFSLIHILNFRYDLENSPMTFSS